MFLLIMVIIIAISIIGIMLNKDKKEKVKNADEKINTYMNQNGIKATKYVNIPLKNGEAKFVVDENGNYVYYLIGNNENDNINYKKISFKDVIKCELIKDSKTKLVEDKFSIFDNYNNKEYVKKFGLRITFNDLSFPHLDILFLNSLQGMTLTGLSHIVNATNEWISIMNIVIERGRELKKTN